MKQKILMDTNFVMIPSQFKVDIYSEINRIMEKPYELYVLDKTITELNSVISHGKGQNKAKARLAKAILESKLKLGKVKLIQAHIALGKSKGLKTTSKAYVDKVILGLNGFIIATQDKDLRLKLKEKGIQTILLRKKQYLVLD